MNRIEELIDAAASAVDEQRLERAQALAQIATAQALAIMAERVGKLASILGTIETNMSERGIEAAYQAGYAAALQDDYTDDGEDPNA